MSKTKFKELTDENIEYLRFVYNDEDMKHDEKMKILSEKFGVAPRTIRSWWQKLDFSGSGNGFLPLQLLKARERELNLNTDIVFFTAAQNKTAINRKFWNNLLAYKKYLEEVQEKTVQIVVAPSRYRNPTNSIEADKKRAEQWWVDEIRPYLYYGKYMFGDVLLSTNSRIRPTARTPLSGYEILAEDRSVILPHSKIHFKTLPRFKKGILRTMSTTGFLTVRNYSDSKAGERGFQHHSYGFVVVEKKEDDTCHIPRNVKVKADGCFTDLIFEVDNEEVSIIEETEGFVWGDLHAAEVNREIFDRTLDLYELFKPKVSVIHDLWDGSTVNPHEEKDMFIQRRKIVENRYLIKDEIQHSFDLVSEISDTGSDVNVVTSNHDHFLDRHVNNANWKKDLHNSPFYLECAQIQQTVDLRDYGCIYGYLLNKEFDGKIKYINFGDSLRISGYECALHGDHGTNGARGTATTFAKINTKMIAGHSHSPIIIDGYTGVGITCNKDQYYTRKGLSSWAYAHSVIHPNGKNQLLVFDNDNKISSLI